MSGNFRRTALRRAFALTSYISPRLNTELLFRQRFGRRPELDSPRTLNEKLLKLKLGPWAHDDLIRRCADKFAVREYVAQKGCAPLLNELLAVYSSAEELDWQSLPPRFVLKWNFGCGYNIICRDKDKLDESEVRAQLKKWGREDFWAYYSELQYRHIPKRLLLERYLGTETAAPEDYKFYCFHGRADCVMVCMERELGQPRFYFFDRDWRLLRINRDSRNAPEDFAPPKPAGLDAAFNAADVLSADFPFVRVDLYLVDGRVYFGELTFTPAAGLDNRRLPETDLFFGEKLNLEAL